MPSRPGPTHIDSISKESTTAGQESKHEDHGQAMASHRLSSNVKIPIYDGSFGGTSDFVFKFKNSMKLCFFPPEIISLYSISMSQAMHTNV